jgi:hypothetical protein
MKEAPTQETIPEDYSCQRVPAANPEQVGDCAALMASLDKCFDDNERQWSKCQQGPDSHWPVSQRECDSRICLTLDLGRVEGLQGLHRKEATGREGLGAEIAGTPTAVCSRESNLPL